MKEDLPPHKGRLPGMQSMADHLAKRPAFGINQGGSSKRGAPAKVAARNGDIQRLNPAGQKNAGVTSGDEPGFDNLPDILGGQPGFEGSE